MRTPDAELYTLIDEAGTPVFASGRSSARQSFVVCAVALPHRDRLLLRKVLPRDALGQFLKSSSRTTTDAAVATFFARLLDAGADVGLVCVDTVHPKSVAAAVAATKIANESRRSTIDRPLLPAHLIYELLVADAIANVWAAASTQRSRFVGSLDVVIDTFGLRKYEHGLFARKLRTSVQEKGPKIHDLGWKTEQEEVLLHAPDLLAGAMVRHHASRDCPRTWNAVLAAAKANRIRLQNGREFKTLPDDAFGAEAAG